jgi:hypothetical protein
MLHHATICRRMTDRKDMQEDKSTARFRRVLEKIEHSIPQPLIGLWAGLRRPGAALMRLPLAILLIIGGIFSFLPVLGLWMLPLGLLLLAIDIPILRGPISSGVVRLRRWWRRIVAQRRRR